MRWLAAGLGPVDQDPDEVRRTACELLNPSVVCSTVEPPPDPPDPPDVGPLWLLLELLLWGVIIGVLGLLVWLLVRALVTRRRNPRDEDATDDDVVETVGEVVVDRSREPFSWRDEADRHLAAGRLRDALRCRYRALVGDLARRGLLDEIPGRTTGEERSQLAVSTPDVIADFAAAADLFDAAWYGDLAVDRADIDRFLVWERAVLDATARPARRRVGAGR